MCETRPIYFFKTCIKLFKQRIPFIQWKFICNSLSNSTFYAFQKIRNGLYGSETFALNILNIGYVLFNKCQTVPLEDQFSLYRQLSDRHYYVSPTAVD